MSETTVELAAGLVEVEVELDSTSPVDVVVGGAPEIEVTVDDGAWADESTVVIGVQGPKGDPGPAADAEALVAQHVASPEPHPAYDDLPDLTLLFENGLV